jgi:hypothetical protein
MMKEIETEGIGKFETPKWKVIELEPDQIDRLISKEGLTIVIDPYNDTKVDEANLEKRRPQDLKLAFVSQKETFQRVFLPMLVVEDENGTDNFNFNKMSLSHLGVAPTVDFEGHPVTLLGKQGAKLDLVQLQMRFDDVNDRNRLRVAVENMNKSLLWNPVSGALNADYLMRQEIVPLTGTFRFQVETKRPKRAAIVLEYISRG